MITEIAAVISAVIATGGALVGAGRGLIQYGKNVQAEKERLNQIEKRLEP